MTRSFVHYRCRCTIECYLVCVVEIKKVSFALSLSPRLVCLPSLQPGSPLPEVEGPMEPCQRGDWSATRHVAVRFDDDPNAISRVEYTWVHMVDIEKRIPMSTTLTEPGFDGAFRIPVESAAIPVACCIVLRVVYTDGCEAYGLVTAKHFSNTYTDTRGHKVKRVSVLARAPLAWVIMNEPPVSAASSKKYPFAGDAFHGHQPEMIVSRVYATLNLHVRNAFVSRARVADSAEGDRLTSEVVSDTLSALGAPLAFKVLHEQSRLTLERLRDRSEISTIPDPRTALWGTCVSWQLDSRDALSRASVNQDADPSPTVPSTDRWLRVRLTHAGLEVTRYSGGTSVTKDVIRAPYWVVILTAICCGALDRWSRGLAELHEFLRVDRGPPRSGERESEELCQRCGYACRISPAVCEPEPKRVSAVLQIDKLLLGGICTTLCATVSRERTATGTESEDTLAYQCRATGSEREGRYCLNHRRVYSASSEEKRDRERWLGEGREERREERKRRQTRRGRRAPRAGLRFLSPQSRKGARTHRVASWWENASRIYWGQHPAGEGEEKEEWERGLQRYGSKPIFTCEAEDGAGEDEDGEDGEDEGQRREGDERTRNRDVRDEDAGLWSWQKDCRDRQRERLGYARDDTTRKHRFWELYHQPSGSQQRRGDESGSRSSTAVGYWKRFTCQVLGYHIKTLPFGQRGGLLDV